MDISSLTNISSDYITQAYNQSKAASAQEENSDSFGSVFDTAVKMLNETNDYQNDAEKDIMLSFCIQGCFHAYLNNQEKDVATLVSVSESIVRRLAPMYMEEVTEEA